MTHTVTGNITTKYMQDLLEIYDRMRKQSDGTGNANPELMQSHYEREYVQSEFIRHLDKRTWGVSTYEVYTKDTYDNGYPYWREVASFDTLTDALARAERILYETPDAVVAFGVTECNKYAPPHDLLRD